MEHAQHADQRKSQFLAAVSHELRTPLNAIIGFSTVLLDELGGPLTDAQREDLESINQNGRYLLHMINDLLDMARIEAGRLDLDLEPLSLRVVVSDVVDTIQGLLRGKSVVVRQSIPDGLPSALGDAYHVRQIMLNLLSNAVKFTDQGSITVSAREIAAPEGAASFVEISVRDSGIGIAAEHLPLIFDEFRQVHGQQSRQRGTGLGLAIARRLVAAQNGTISVESAPGAGSTFRFTLPVAAVSATFVAPPPTPEHYAEPTGPVHRR
jgi:two-component system sensor histidine kinase/response regulator